MREPLSCHERRVALKTVAAIWCFIALGVIVAASLGGFKSLTWERLTRPVDDPSGWQVVERYRGGRVTERPADVADMAERQYMPFILAGGGVFWGVTSVVIFAQACRRKRTALTRFALWAMNG